MSERLAVDTNAVVDLFRTGTTPPPIRNSKRVFLPLTVIGELYGGAYSSHQVRENLALVDHVVERWTLLVPDIRTARVYGRLRADLGILQNLKQSRINDSWIAALCLQHNLPLLTNDRGFDHIPNLTVLHW